MDSSNATTLLGVVTILWNINSINLEQPSSCIYSCHKHLCSNRCIQTITTTNYQGMLKLHQIHQREAIHSQTNNDPLDLILHHLQREYNATLPSHGAQGHNHHYRGGFIGCDQVYIVLLERDWNLSEKSTLLSTKTRCNNMWIMLISIRTRGSKRETYCGRSSIVLLLLFMSMLWDGHFLVGLCLWWGRFRF